MPSLQRMKEITPNELKLKLDANEEVQIIDVREPYEANICEIGGLLIPMSEVMMNLNQIRKDVDVIVHCRSGGRSGAIVQALERKGYNNLINLKGGILAWADQVDTSLEKY